MTPAAGARRRTRLPRGEGQQLREEIIDATERLLLDTESAEAVSIRAVADAVGVTAPSIYRHFPDKTALIFEVCNRRFSQLDAFLPEAIEGVDDPVDSLRGLGRAYVEFGTSNPEYYRIMFMTRATDTPEEFQGERLGDLVAFGRLVTCVQRCIDAGRFQPEHRDAIRLAMVIWSQVHGLTSLLVSKPNFPWPEGFVDDYLETSLRGVVAA